MTVTDSLDQSLRRIAEWVRSQPLAAPSPLNPPASGADIDSLGRAIGLDIPPPLAALLRFSDGLDWYGLFPAGERLMSCAQIECACVRYTEIARQNDDPDWWRPAWIPFAECQDDHEGFLIDAGHPAHPILRYTEADYPYLYVPSMARLMQALTAALHGAQNDPGLPFCGRSASVADGVIEWS